MKKMKRFLSLMLSVMTCSAYVCSIQSSALGWSVNSSDLEEFLSDWTKIESDELDEWYKVARFNPDNIVGMYIYNEPRCYNLMLLHQIDAFISCDISEDADYSELSEICEEFGVTCSYVNTRPADNSQYWNIKNCSTKEQARELYEVFKENGWIEKGWILNFRYYPEHYDYQEGDFYDRSMTFFEHKKEIIEQCIAEKELNCHLVEDAEEIVKTINANNGNPDKPITQSDIDSYKGLILVEPDDEMSTIDKLLFSVQIINYTGANGMGPGFLLSGNSISCGGSIEMHDTILGDANEDEELGVADVVTIMQAIADPDNNKLTDQGKYNADIAGDYDGITGEDALAVKKKLLGID